MMRHGLWQEQGLQEVSVLFGADKDVRAVLVTGSLAWTEAPDTWSDIDLVIVLTDGMLDCYFPHTSWLAALGEVYGLEQATARWGGVTRVCRADLRRFDFIFIAESAFPTAEVWAGTPLGTGARTLFSRSETVDTALIRTLSPPAFEPLSTERFERMVEQFRFKAMVAVSKVMRDDLLIALHLALDLVRDCCILGMALRDRATETTRHRIGGSGNLLVPRLEAPRQPYTALNILDGVTRSSLIFDELARQWDPAYQDYQQPLLAWINEAREALVV